MIPLPSATAVVLYILTMQKRVINTLRSEAVSRRGKRVTIRLEYICTLECGHIESRIRSTPPDRLKCSSCNQH
jgi:hypothetical protein